MLAATSYTKAVLQDLKVLPEALKKSDAQDKCRKFVIQFFPLNIDLIHSLKAANYFYAPLGLGTTFQSLYKEINLLGKVKFTLISFMQTTDLITSLNNLDLVPIHKIIHYIKKLDVFQFLKNSHLGSDNVLSQLVLFKEGCFFASTGISLWSQADKSIYFKKGDKDKVDVRLLSDRVADGFKLAVVGLSLAKSLTSVGNIQVHTRFGVVTPNKVINGLSYCSAAASFFKSIRRN